MFPAQLTYADVNVVEKRLIEMVGPYGTAIGVLQQKVAEQETRFVQLKQVEQNADKSIREAKQVLLQMNKEVELKFEQFQKTIQTRDFEWERKINNNNINTKSLQKEMQEVGVQFFERMESFEEEERER